MNNELQKRIFTSITLLTGIVFLTFVDPVVFQISVFLIMIICYLEWSKFNEYYFKKNPLKYFLIKLFGVIYLTFVAYSAYHLRGSSFEEAIFFIFILSICASSDVGGYVFGKSIGGKKLTKISPKKTVSGSIGSFITSLIPIIFCSFFDNLNFIIDFNFVNIFFVLLISFFCQVGDIFISYFKRLNKVKDTGSILPGHGGFLDRIDGMIVAIPVAYIFDSLNFIV